MSDCIHEKRKILGQRVGLVKGKRSNCSVINCIYGYNGDKFMEKVCHPLLAALGVEARGELQQ